MKSYKRMCKIKVKFELIIRLVPGNNNNNKLSKVQPEPTQVRSFHHLPLHLSMAAPNNLDEDDNY
jgi:hypothetical protein